MNEFLNVTLENIDIEHLCCAISDKKHQVGVDLKKEWLRNRLEEGHVFRKLNKNGKVFIEFAPLEKSWVPVNGDNYLYIYCLWVSGSFKENGYGKSLIEYAMDEAKRLGKNGICTISSKKKKPFISEKKFFEHYGFKTVDSLEDYELLALSFNDKFPSFCESVKKNKIDSQDLTIFYSPQLPFTNHCVEELTDYANLNKVKINFERIDTLEKAKNMPCIFNNWATFYQGKFVSNTLLNANMVEKLLKQ